MSDDASLPNAFPTVLATLTALALLAGPLAGTATGHGEAYTITLTAYESGCTGDATYCYEVTEGSFDEVQKGEELRIRLVNAAENSLEHNVNIGPLSAASEDRDTDESEAVSSTETIPPGEEAIVEVTPTSSYDGLYLWCSVGVHEDQGMYIEHAFDGAVDPNSDGDGGDTDPNQSPTPGAIGALAALAGLAVVLRRD